MNSKKLNIDDYTKDLVQKGELKQPGDDFTKNVMGKILKDPSVEVSFVTRDERNNNLWLIISIAIIVVGFFIFQIVKKGFNLANISLEIKTSSLFTYFLDFFTRLWKEISFSPYILIALIGVIFLVVIDRTIVKYLYSI